ncbi:UNVERIFIED_CONTAM: hypothetical protein RMT77_015547 [Armadillidium vulgare]
MSTKRKLESNTENLFKNEENLQDIFTDDLCKLNLSSDESEAESENENESKNKIDADDESDQWEDIDSESDNDDDFDSDIIEDTDSEDLDKNECEEENYPPFIEDKEEGHQSPEEDVSVDIKKQKRTRKKKAKKNVKKDTKSDTESGYGGGSSKEGDEDQTSYNEYEYDSSDEEDLRNTIGNIPINWYDEYEHLGYGLDSLPICKPNQGDSLDKFLDRLENPDHGRTVFDKQTGQKVRLSDHHLGLVKRLLKGRVPDPQYNMYEPFLDLFSHEVMEMALSGRQEHKKSFLPVKAERQKVARLAYLIKNGWYKRLNKPKKEVTKYYDIWQPRSDEEPKLMGIRDHIPAPKVPLPGHGDSYNPPAEYLVTRKDERVLKGKEKGDGDLFKRFWRKFPSVREIPFYPKTIKERYNRLLDLYLAPRKRYRKIVAQAKDFLPKFPDVKDCRPFPTLEALIFEGHRSIVRTISVHPNGKYLASGSDDHTVRIWEVSTGRCLRTFEVEEVVLKVSWNPSNKLFLLGIAMGKMVVFLNPETYLTDKIVVQQTNSIFKSEVEQGDYMAPERITAAVTWRRPTENEWQRGYRVVLDHFKEVREIVWHRQGDYFATLMPEGIHRSVILHQLSKWRSQLILGKLKGRVQRVLFHPKEPLLFVATQASVHIFNLKRQCRIKKVQANCRYISCLAVHPGGEHFVIGGYDRKVNWFEMECTKRPHLMRYHGHAVRSINFHRKYPLFASCSDDKKLQVVHATVYDDLLKDPYIRPVKLLKGHKTFDDYYVLDVAWHPYEPYLFSAGADATIRLWH